MGLAERDLMSVDSNACHNPVVAPRLTPFYASIPGLLPGLTAGATPSAFEIDSVTVTQWNGRVFSIRQHHSNSSPFTSFCPASAV